MNRGSQANTVRFSDESRQAGALKLADTRSRIQFNGRQFGVITASGEHWICHTHHVLVRLLLRWFPLLGDVCISEEETRQSHSELHTMKATTSPSPSRCFHSGAI